MSSFALKFLISRIWNIYGILYNKNSWIFAFRGSLIILCRIELTNLAMVSQIDTNFGPFYINWIIQMSPNKCNILYHIFGKLIFLVHNYFFFGFQSTNFSKFGYNVLTLIFLSVSPISSECICNTAKKYWHDMKMLKFIEIADFSYTDESTIG